MRLYDPNYGRFLSTDPLWSKYLPLQSYQYAGNSPGQVVAHELYLHAYFFLRAKAGEDVSPLHRQSKKDPPTEVDRDQKMVEKNATK